MSQLDIFSFIDQRTPEKTNQIAWIPIDQLLPHPDNPRLIYREDIIETIAQSIQETGFNPCYALLVRPFEGAYQIISGHTRHKASLKAGIDSLPCWIKEMDDDAAFMELVLANNQGELSPLEYGMHVLKYVELSEGGRGKKGGLSEYARVVGKARQNLGKYQEAATVVKNLNLNNVMQVLDKANHLAAIHKAPQPYWQTLVELLIENEWSVKQTEAIVTAIKDVHIPEHFHFWLNPDKAIKETIAEALTGEIRTPRDIKNWVEAAQKQMDELPESRKVTIVQDDKEEIQYLDLRAEFLNRLPELCKGSKKPSAKGINAIAAELLKRATQLDEEHKKWVESRANADFLAAQAEKERLRILELTEQFTPIGFNSPLQELEQLQGEWLNSFDAIITDVPYLLSNDGTTVRSGKEASVNKGFADRRGEAIEPSQYMSLFFNALKPGGYFVTTCTIHVLMDLMAEGDKAGFVLRQKLIWYKRNSPPLFTADRFQPDYEDVLVFVKPGETPYFGYEEVKDGDRQRGATIDIPQCAGKERTEHTTQKPESLYELLIKAYTQQGDRVLEPFAGSGTTPAVCKRLGRRCIWVEQEQKFFNIASDRIESTPYFWEV